MHPGDFRGTEREGRFDGEEAIDGTGESAERDAGEGRETRSAGDLLSVPALEKEEVAPREEAAGDGQGVDGG